MGATKNTINLLLKDALTELYKASNSRKKKEYTLNDALEHKHLGSERTKVIIDAFSFLAKEPLLKNDYYKYFNAYAGSGIKLNPEYFKHDLEKLNDYYKKFDDKKLKPFNIQKYREYVVYISLKLYGCYLPTDDKIFNISNNGNREYNPLTSVPSVIRGELPFKVKEYDIKQAFPTFIDIELKSDYRQKVYNTISKKEFAIALNSHIDSNVSLEDAKKTLQKVYSNRVDEVLTLERFNERGKAFNDFIEYEQEYINEFVKSNDLKNFARLHDGVFVLDTINVVNTKFDKVEFAIKECIKPKVINKKVLFYEFDYSGKVILTPTGISDFLKQENFIRITSTDDKIQLLENSNNVIDYFNHKTNIVSFLERKIVEVDKTAVKDAIARHNFSTIAQSFSLIPPSKLEYYKDKKNSFGLPFKNGFIYFDSLDKMELKTKPYKEVKGFFAPHTVQDKTFTYTDEIGDFETFLFRVSTGLKDYDKNNSDFKSLCSIVGYCSTSYKKPNDNPIIILTDEGANETNRKGRRGKSLVTLAIGNVTKKITKTNKDFQPNYLHNYADLDKSYNFYVIDDVSAGFSFNDLYTESTGSISVQPKGKAAFEIDFEDTPKFLVTTNYIFRLNKDDASSVARFVELKFKPYYSIKHTPVMEFGGLFFDDWDATEWNKFYSFIYRCVFDYLKNGLKKIDYNKEDDNFNATFNDANEYLMNDILKRITKDNEAFKVSDVLEQLRLYDRALTSDNFIHKNNAKRLIDLFIESNKGFQHYEYVKRFKEWQVKD
jgi:hypothetical protein